MSVIPSNHRTPQNRSIEVAQREAAFNDRCEFRQWCGTAGTSAKQRMLAEVPISSVIDGHSGPSSPDGCNPCGRPIHIVREAVTESQNLFFSVRYHSRGAAGWPALTVPPNVARGN